MLVCSPQEVLNVLEDWNGHQLVESLVVKVATVIEENSEAANQVESMRRCRVESSGMLAGL